jgi:hypothetical protein
MERLRNAFVGKWTVKEAFEVSASKRGKTREGSPPSGPGFSLTEDSQSNGSGGELHFLAGEFVRTFSFLKGGMGTKQRKKLAESLAAVPCDEPRDRPEVTLARDLTIHVLIRFFLRCRSRGKVRCSSTRAACIVSRTTRAKFHVYDYADVMVAVLARM